MTNPGFSKRFIEKRYFGPKNASLKEWDLLQRYQNRKYITWASRCYVVASNAQTFRSKSIVWWKARRAEHMALWNWVSKYSCRAKTQWPGWKKNGGKVRDNIDNCIPCSIAGMCSYCPVGWGCDPDADNGCQEFGSPYDKWVASRKSVQRCIGWHWWRDTKYAEQVRDLEWFFEKEI